MLPKVVKIKHQRSSVIRWSLIRHVWPGLLDCHGIPNPCTWTFPTSWTVYHLYYLTCIFVENAFTTLDYNKHLHNVCAHTLAGKFCWKNFFTRKSNFHGDWDSQKYSLQQFALLYSPMHILKENLYMQFFFCENSKPKILQTFLLWKCLPIW